MTSQPWILGVRGGPDFMVAPSSNHGHGHGHSMLQVVVALS